MKLSKLLSTVVLCILISGILAIPTIASPEEYGPRADDMLIHIFLSPEAENEALDAGIIDIGDWPLPKEYIDKWKDDPDIELKNYAEIGQMEFDLNNQKWPTGVTLPRTLDPETDTYKHWYGTSEWDDEAKNFRIALAYLTDKDRYVAELLKGYGYRMDTCVPVPALAGWTDYASLEANIVHELYSITGEGLIYHYDREIAAGILDYAGFTQGSTPNPYYDSEKPGSAEYIRTDPQYGGDLAPVVFWVRMDDPNRKAAGEMLAAECQLVGIPVELHVSEKTVCYKQAMVLYDFNVYTGGWSLSRDLDFIYDLYAAYVYWGGTETSYYGGVGWSVNYDGNCDPAFEVPGKLCKYGITFEEVRAAGLEAQQVFQEHCPAIPLWCSAAVKAHRADWEGVINQEGFGIDNSWTFLNMYNPTDSTIDYGFKSNLEGPSIICAEWLWDWNVLGLVYDSLLGANPYNLAEDVGWLATDWETGLWDVGKLYANFTLRQNAYFHDDVTQVTPEDVEFSLEFTRDCGPGVAWLYTSAMNIEEVDTWDHTATGGDWGVYVKFDCESYWALHWAGGIPIIHKAIWMAACGPGTDAGYDPATHTFVDAAKVREYHPWNTDADENGVIDMKEDGTGPWKYHSAEKPEAISASTWILLTANKGSTFYKTQTEVANYLADAFHRVGDVNSDGVIDILDGYIISKAMGTNKWDNPHGTGWGFYNSIADITTTPEGIPWAIHGPGYGYVDIFDLALWAMNYGKGM